MIIFLAKYEVEIILVKLLLWFLCEFLYDYLIVYRINCVYRIYCYPKQWNVNYEKQKGKIFRSAGAVSGSPVSKIFIYIL